VFAKRPTRSVLATPPTVLGGDRAVVTTVVMTDGVRASCPPSIAQSQHAHSNAQLDPFLLATPAAVLGGAMAQS